MTSIQKKKATRTESISQGQSILLLLSLSGFCSISSTYSLSSRIGKNNIFGNRLQNTKKLPQFTLSSVISGKKTRRLRHCKQKTSKAKGKLPANKIREKACEHRHYARFRINPVIRKDHNISFLSEDNARLFSPERKSFNAQEKESAPAINTR